MNRIKGVAKNVLAARWLAPVVAALALMLSFFNVGLIKAQTPVPSLNIPTSTIFNEANTWIQVFAPIAAIGIGIAIAIAVLGYVGKMIIDAFR